MALVLDATPKSLNANSYVTRAEADAYFEGRLNSDKWTGASNAEKDQALVAATTRLEQESYKGTRTDLEQRLKWPRQWVPLDDDYVSWYDGETVARPIKEACYELALDLLNAAKVDRAANTGLEGFIDVSIGPISVTVDKSYKAGQLPIAIGRMLRNFLTSQAGTFRLIRS